MLLVTEIFTGLFRQKTPRLVLRKEFDFWNVHGIMNTSGLLQSK